MDNLSKPLLDGKSPKQRHRLGFTLVELSIVLVIIGLIVGGIMVGQSLIRASELKAIATEVDKYSIAVNLFKGKYNAIPGDMANATDYWGTAAAGCPAGGVATSPATCNGDGSGTICTGTQTNHGGDCLEALRAWQHLSNSGFIAGVYPGNNTEIVGTTLPSFKGTKTGFEMFYWGNVSGISGFFDNTYPGHVISYGMQSPQTAGNFLDQSFQPALTTTDAYSIDLKIDDGRPGTGKLITMKKNSYFTPDFTSTNACVTTTSITTAVYDLTQTSLQCALFFEVAF